MKKNKIFALIMAIIISLILSSCEKIIIKTGINNIVLFIISDKLNLFNILSFKIMCL